MKVLCVIPARMGSNRLPGKPLKDIAGKTLIQRVWEQIRKTNCFDEKLIATDSPEILTEAARIGAQSMETSATALTGSDRVAEVLNAFERQGKTFDLVANVQGDMPFINPIVIEKTVAALQNASADFGMATVATPITDREEFERPSVVKVAVGTSGQALYFSRGMIPFPRTAPDEGEYISLKHIGLYVFRSSTLKLLSSLSQSIPEKREGLEQLRLLSNGVKVLVKVIERETLEPSIEVDTPDDLARAGCLASKLTEIS